MAKATT